MGTRTAESIIATVRVLANDARAGKYRREDPEYLAWLNDAQRRICTVIPEESTVHGDVSLVSGIWQQLPAEATKLIRPLCNMVGAQPGRSITPATEALMDSSTPDWRSTDASGEIKHVMYDPAYGSRDFSVYPPAVAGSTIRVVYGVVPDDIAMDDPIVVNDRFVNAIQAYMLFRYYSVDAEDASNANVAATYYKLFAEEIS